jgi:NAD(P)-dependent dehydrogenase (short-subunit alcohol dehydrogenase family)
MQGRFTRKVAIVTGGASGIGRAIAERLAREGAAVLVADCDAASSRAVIESAALAGGIARFAETDVTRASDCARMVESAVEGWGGLDLLVCSAGVGAGGPIATMDEETWDRVHRVNLTGTFLSARAVFPALSARGGGSIVTIASMAGILAAPGFGAYASSKAGVIQLTRVLAVEGAPQGIRANSLCPIWIDTPLLRRHLESAPNPDRARREMVRRIPLSRIGSVEDVAAAALFLASDEAAFITGVALPVDGGAMCG